MDGSHAQVRSQTATALSAAGVEKRLDLRRRARADGGRNLPRADATELSEAERLVMTTVAAERRRIDQNRAEARAEAERRLRALAPSPQDLSGPVIEARLALRQVEGRLTRDWAVMSERARQAKTDLDGFRRIHNLRRAAVTPASTLLQAGLLFLAALFESLFSATLFAEADARGLLGGAITAIGLSGANVVIGFLAGYVGLRYLQHTKPVTKAAGALGFALFFSFAVILNGGAAAWRDMLAAPDDGSDASATLWTAVLHLHSPQAVVLLMLGAGVWVFAALKGYSKFDDPYPDYGKIDRAARDAEEALSEFRAEAREELEAPIDSARNALAARLEKTRAEYEAMNRAYDAAALKIEAINDKARAWDDAGSSAVQLYRQENIAVRTAPAPAYFAAPPPHVGPAPDALAGCGAMIEEARALLARAQEQSALAFETLVKELDDAQQRLDAAAT